MEFESDKDRLAILKATGELVTFSVGQVSWDVYGIVETAFVEVNRTEGFRPTVLCREIDTTRRAGEVVVNGTLIQTSVGSFEVVTPQPDGAGLVLLILGVVG